MSINDYQEKVCKVNPFYLYVCVLFHVSIWKIIVMNRYQSPFSCCHWQARELKARHVCVCVCGGGGGEGIDSVW